MTSKMSPDIQAVFDRLAALTGQGYYIRHYPALTAITGNAHFSIVFSRLLFHEDRRLRRGASFFTGTDKQLADECGLGEYQFATARDLICAPGILLFSRELHGMPAISHYRGHLDRVNAWLDLNGFGQVQLPLPTSSGKNQELDTGKPDNLFREKPASLKNSEKNSVVDDDARKRIQSAEQILKEWGIENPSRQRILDRLGNRTDLIDVIRWTCEQTTKQWAYGVNNDREIIKRPVGLIISRLLNEV